MNPAFPGLAAHNQPPRRIALATLTALLTLTPAAPALAAEATLAPVVVTATRQPTRSNELLADVSVLTRADIEQAGHGSLEALLAQEAGVEFTANGGPGTNSSVFLRGANGRHTLVLIDGLRMGSATSGDVAFSRLPLSQIERIEILRGPASSLYGADAIGGVIQIFTRQGQSGPARVAVMAGIGSQGTAATEASVSGGDTHWSYALSAGWQESDGFSAIRNPANSNYSPDRDPYRNRNLGARLAWRPSSGNEFGASITHSDGTSAYDSWPGSSDFRNRQSLTATQAYARNRLTDAWTSTLRLGRTTDDATNETNRLATSLFRTDQDQFSWQNDIVLPVGRALLATEYLRQSVDSTTAFPVTERSIRSLLAGWSGNFGPHRLQTNLRHDDNSQFGGKTTGFAGYGYQLSEAWRTHLSYGTAFRAPSFNELYFPDTGYGGGNPRLRPETARNTEAGLIWENPGTGSGNGLQRLGLIAYHNRVHDLIADWPPANVNNATLQGASLSAAGRLADWQLQAVLDLSHGRDDATGRRLARRADEQLKLKALRKAGAWQYGAEWQLVGDRYDDAANRKPLAGYGLVNLLASYQLDREWQVFARANNVFDQRYELARDYGTPGANLFVGLRYAPR